MRRVALVLLFLCSPLLAQYDTLIRNGRLVDGTGNPWFYADIGITNDRITFIGTAPQDATAKRTIDAKGLVIAPGFIDMLGQSELDLLIDNRATSKLRQGITTEITGEGDTAAPLNDRLKNDAKDFTDHFHVTLDWTDFDGYFFRLAKAKPGVNLGTYVGAAQVRNYVIGTANRAPTADELKDMQDLVDDAMSQGAMGLSSALMYAPGQYAKTDELIALAKIAAAHDGIYSSHIRNESEDEMSAIHEVEQIAREAHIPAEIWHLKVAGKDNWGKMPAILAEINKARAEDLDITADLYPYIASATSLGALIPARYHEGGADAFVKRLQDPATRAEIKKLLLSNEQGFDNMWRGTGGGKGILVISVLKPELKKYEGMNIEQIAAAENKDQLDAILDLVAADHDNVGAVYFEMNEDDLKLAMREPWVSFDTDYGEAAEDGPLSESKTHPRSWGTFARVLGKYVRDDHNLSLEDAIRKASSQPAARMKLRDRGLLKTGYFADVVIFDPDKIHDVATFADPNHPSIGFRYVFVNGVLSVENDKLTGQTGGRPLRGPGWKFRDDIPEGQPARGAIQGMVTDEDGYPVFRVKVTLLDATGKELSSKNNRRDGHFTFETTAPCADCSIKVERSGFEAQSSKLNYNGANEVWINYRLTRTK
ncbi:N-acyl-D-amino-acid deacylase [Candidatus Koribacter versatilis Ellin345]|uniref:N-acyl-D-amino-acid deacylase n=1 Tax=Koribacter versatilis (strain Ellin345) TaxID=204669 RepID=Q1INE0_KORVE|nr:amidohydrolase family protein [Candidatus Koribacter versatilis]ABF41610.1 N-acyl-D-amino-acid deacylase [Candidatus Koribacter versatilis Ellin345]